MFSFRHLESSLGHPCIGAPCRSQEYRTNPIPYPDTGAPGNTKRNGDDRLATPDNENTPIEPPRIFSNLHVFSEEPNPISGHFGSSAGLRARLPHPALSFGFVGVVGAIVFGAVIIIVAFAVLRADFVQDD